MSRILPRSFFERSAVAVARNLIGCALARRVRGRTRRFLITEAEAYEGPRDRGSHASRGRTPRNEPMFGEAGRFYVYLVYGNHWMLNVVTGRTGHPAAVLIRSVEGYRGPGRLTKALHITGRLNAKPARQRSGLWFERGGRIPASCIRRTPRIGIDYAGPIWSKKLYRFLLAEKKK